MKPSGDHATQSRRLSILSREKITREAKSWSERTKFAGSFFLSAHLQPSSKSQCDATTSEDERGMIRNTNENSVDRDLILPRAARRQLLTLLTRLVFQRLLPQSHHPI